MPLARTALYAQGEDLHVMLWPGCLRLTCDITKFIAKESRSFVISASGIIRPSDIPDGVPYRDEMIGDEEVFSMNFVPNLSTVAALDAGQASTLALVSEVSGQVWVNKSTQRITQEQVTVRYSEPNGAQSAVEITLRFSAFNEPVEIERQ